MRWAFNAFRGRISDSVRRRPAAAPLVFLPEESGLTMRAFSHHLALCMPNEVHCEWYMLPVNTQGFCLNLILLPWPKSVRPAQFQPAPGPNPTIHHRSHEMFTLRASDFDDSDVKKLRAVLKAKRKSRENRWGSFAGIDSREWTSRTGQECRARQRFLSDLRRRGAGTHFQAGGTADKLISLFLRQVDYRRRVSPFCRGLGSRGFTERFHGDALVTHFQHGQVFCTAR